MPDLPGSLLPIPPWLQSIGRGQPHLVEADWGATPLGHPTTWPVGLRNAIMASLSSRIPMVIWWGTELLMVYNAAHAAILGPRHPAALGHSARGVWTDVWPVIGQQVAQVMATGAATLTDCGRAPIERDGRLQDAWFTWSFSPIFDDSGTIVGLLLASIEETQRVNSERERDRLADQHRLALNAARMGWWHYDPLTRVATWDDRYREIFGVSGTQSPNDQILKRLHPEDLPAVLAAVDAALNPHDPKPYSITYRVIRDDGSIAHIEAHGIAAFSGDGNERRATSFVGTVTDVTERVLADDRSKNILESITDAFFALDRHWRFTYINPQTEKVLGFTAAELIGRDIWDVYPGLHSSEFETVYRSVVANRQAQSFTAYYPDHDRWYEVHAYPAANGLAIYFRDATERKRAEIALRDLAGKYEHQSRLFECIASTTPDFIYIFDLQGRFLYANRRLLEV